MEVQSEPSTCQDEQTYSFMDNVELKIKSSSLNFGKLARNTELRKNKKIKAEQGLFKSCFSIDSSNEQGIEQKSNSFSSLPQKISFGIDTMGSSRSGLKRSSKGRRNLFEMDE